MLETGFRRWTTSAHPTRLTGGARTHGMADAETRFSESRARRRAVRAVLCFQKFSKRQVTFERDRPVLFWVFVCFCSKVYPSVRDLTSLHLPSTFTATKSPHLKILRVCIRAPFIYRFTAYSRSRYIRVGNRPTQTIALDRYNLKLLSLWHLTLMYRVAISGRCCGVEANRFANFTNLHIPA